MGYHYRQYHYRHHYYHPHIITISLIIIIIRFGTFKTASVLFSHLLLPPILHSHENVQKSLFKVLSDRGW